MFSHCQMWVHSSARESTRTHWRIFFWVPTPTWWNSWQPQCASISKNMQALQVINSFVKGPVKGNCRGFDDGTHKELTEEETGSLLKRRRKKWLYFRSYPFNTSIGMQASTDHSKDHKTTYSRSHNIQDMTKSIVKTFVCHTHTSLSLSLRISWNKKCHKTTYSRSHSI